MRRLEDWIDYMEKEVDPQKLDQLKMLLKHSISDQEVLDNLRRLRKWLLWADPAENIDYIIEDKKFEKNFHRQIMQTITERKELPQLIKSEG
jgi:site-specific recombinase